MFNHLLLQAANCSTRSDLLQKVLDPQSKTKDCAARHDLKGSKQGSWQSPLKGIMKTPKRQIINQNSSSEDDNGSEDLSYIKGQNINTFDLTPLASSTQIEETPKLKHHKHNSSKNKKHEYDDQNNTSKKSKNGSIAERYRTISASDNDYSDSEAVMQSGKSKKSKHRKKSRPNLSEDSTSNLTLNKHKTGSSSDANSQSDSYQKLKQSKKIKTDVSEREENFINDKPLLKNKKLKEMNLKQKHAVTLSSKSIIQKTKHEKNSSNSDSSTSSSNYKKKSKLMTKMSKVSNDSDSESSSNYKNKSKLKTKMSEVSNDSDSESSNSSTNNFQQTFKQKKVTHSQSNSEIIKFEDRNEQLIKQKPVNNIVIPDDSNYEIFLMQIPKRLHPQLLTDLHLSLVKNTKIIGDDCKYVCSVDSEKQNALNILTAVDKKYRIKTINSVGTITLRKRIKSKKKTNLPMYASDYVEFPNDLKIRHPLFGVNYNSKINLDIKTLTKLHNTEISIKKRTKKAKLQRSKDFKEESHKDEEIFKYLNLGDNNKEGPSTKKFEDQDHTTLPKKAKKMKHLKTEEQIKDEFKYPESNYLLEEHESKKKKLKIKEENIEWTDFEHEKVHKHKKRDKHKNISNEDDVDGILPLTKEFEDYEHSTPPKKLKKRKHFKTEEHIEDEFKYPESNYLSEEHEPKNKKLKIKEEDIEWTDLEHEKVHKHKKRDKHKNNSNEDDSDSVIPSTKIFKDQQHLSPPKKVKKRKHFKTEEQIEDEFKCPESNYLPEEHTPKKKSKIKEENIESTDLKHEKVHKHKKRDKHKKNSNKDDSDSVIHEMLQLMSSKIFDTSPKVHSKSKKSQKHLN